jgi:hypothetical protein
MQNPHFAHKFLSFFSISKVFATCQVHDPTKKGFTLILLLSDRLQLDRQLLGSTVSMVDREA